MKLSVFTNLAKFWKEPGKLSWLLIRYQLKVHSSSATPWPKLVEVPQTLTTHWRTNVVSYKTEYQDLQHKVYSAPIICPHLTALEVPIRPGVLCTGSSFLALQQKRMMRPNGIVMKTQKNCICIKFAFVIPNYIVWNTRCFIPKNVAATNCNWCSLFVYTISTIPHPESKLSSGIIKTERSQLQR